MKDLLPYRGMSPDVEAALVALEKADRFDGLEQAYRIVRQEGDRRIPIFLALVVPTALLGAALIWGVQSLGWLPREAPWAYAFGPIIFVAIVMLRLRPSAARDEARIAKALTKWRTAAAAKGAG